MAKFYGKIGFAQTLQTTVGQQSTGIWEDVIVEKYYKGDILRDTRRWDKGESVNDDLNISNKISIVADSFAVNNLYNMKYIQFMGAFWKVTEVSVEYPRLVLSIGGVYNGNTPVATNAT